MYKVEYRKIKISENRPEFISESFIQKNRLLEDIKKSFLRTKNYAKQITLVNYYETVESLDKDSIDFEWYYNQLKEFKVK